MAKKENEFIITKQEQYDFWKSIAYTTDSSIPGNVRLAAFDKLLDLCGTQTDSARKWVLTMKCED